MQVVFSQDTQLSSAELLALAATNIEVVAAPPAGLAAMPIAVHVFLDHGGTDYVQVNNADQLGLLYSASTVISDIGTEAQCTTLLEASADASLYNLLPITAAGVVPVAATAIDLDNTGTAEYTAGDGTLSIRVFYVLIPMTAFA